MISPSSQLQNIGHDLPLNVFVQPQRINGRHYGGRYEDVGNPRQADHLIDQPDRRADP